MGKEKYRKAQWYRTVAENLTAEERDSELIYIDSNFRELIKVNWTRTIHNIRTITSTSVRSITSISTLEKNVIALMESRIMFRSYNNF